MEVIVLQSLLLGILCVLSAQHLIRKMQQARIRARAKSSNVVNIASYQIRKTGRSHRRGYM